MSDSQHFDPNRVADSGIEGLDAILGGGFPRGRVYMVEGETGTGKTTFGLQFALAGAARDERVLYITLTETETSLRKGAASHGWSLDGVAISEVLLPGKFVDPAQEYDIFDPADIELGEHIQQILEEIERVNPQRLVLDALSSLRLLAADPRRHRRQAECLRRFLDGRNCTSLFIDEILNNPIDVQPRSLVDGIVSLQEVMLEYGSSWQRLRVTKMRTIQYPRTWHSYRINTDGIEIYPHLVASAHQNHHPPGPMASDLPGLDAILNGGLARGRSTLLLGPPGTGKSTLILHYLAAAARRGERSLGYVFNESVKGLIERGEALGLDVQRHIETGNIVLTKVDPNDISPGEFAYRIRTEVESHEAQLVVIDSISGYMNAMPEQRFLPLHIHELLTYLGRQGCVALLAMGERSLMATEAPVSVDLSTLVDTVLLLRFLETDEGIRTILCVVKNRPGPHDHRYHELRFTAQGLTIGPPRPDIRGILAAGGTFSHCRDGCEPQEPDTEEE